MKVQWQVNSHSPVSAHCEGNYIIDIVGPFLRVGSSSGMIQGRDETWRSKQ